MANNKDICGPQDSFRFATDDDYEVDYQTGTVGVSREELQRAVSAVGNSAGAVEEHVKILDSAGQWTSL